MNLGEVIAELEKEVVTLENEAKDWKLKGAWGLVEALNGNARGVRRAIRIVEELRQQYED